LDAQVFLSFYLNFLRYFVVETPLDLVHLENFILQNQETTRTENENGFEDATLIWALNSVMNGLRIVAHALARFSVILPAWILYLGTFTYFLST
jgi:hypothetical protein